MKQAKTSQEDFNNHLKGIRRGKQLKRKKNCQLEEKKTLSNINRLFNGRNDSIKFVQDYGSMILRPTKKQQQKVKDLK